MENQNKILSPPLIRDYTVVHLDYQTIIEVACISFFIKFCVEEYISDILQIIKREIVVRP